MRHEYPQLKNLQLSELNTTPPDFPLARRILNIFFPHPPHNAQEANIALDRYHESPAHYHDDLDQRQVRFIYYALGVLSCLGMGEKHANDIKRFQRSEGHRRSQKREH